MASGSALCADRELQAQLVDQFLGGRLVVDRQRGYRRSYGVEAALRPLEGPQLGVAVGAP